MQFIKKIINLRNTSKNKITNSIEFISRNKPPKFIDLDYSFFYLIGQDETGLGLKRRQLEFFQELDLARIRAYENFRKYSPLIKGELIQISNIPNYNLDTIVIIGVNFFKKEQDGVEEYNTYKDLSEMVQYIVKNIQSFSPYCFTNNSSESEQQKYLRKILNPILTSYNMKRI